MLSVCILLLLAHAGPWPAAAREFLPPDYIPLAEQCWARQALSRPSADQVLQQLVDMLAMVEGV
jgi:hypothetical protein